MKCDVAAFLIASLTNARLIGLRNVSIISETNKEYYYDYHLAVLWPPTIFPYISEFLFPVGSNIARVRSLVGATKYWCSCETFPEQNTSVSIQIQGHSDNPAQAESALDQIQRSRTMLNEYRTRHKMLPVKHFCIYF